MKVLELRDVVIFVLSCSSDIYSVFFRSRKNRVYISCVSFVFFTFNLINFHVRLLYASHPVGFWVTKGVRIRLAYPQAGCIHLFVDNAAYQHVKIVKALLEVPNRQIKLHFIPVSCLHLNPIERLWGVMHKNITHNGCYGSLHEFAKAILVFLRDTVPEYWHKLCNQITDNLPNHQPKQFLDFEVNGV